MVAAVLSVQLRVCESARVFAHWYREQGAVINEADIVISAALDTKHKNIYTSVSTVSITSHVQVLEALCLLLHTVSGTPITIFRGGGPFRPVFRTSRQYCPLIG